MLGRQSLKTLPSRPLFTAEVPVTLQQLTHVPSRTDTLLLSEQQRGECTNSHRIVTTHVSQVLEKIP